MSFLSRITEKFSRKKKIKLGLALGSGGAKGMAHLGALRAFEEAGISFHAVAGTSIGSIVGALYSKGYTSEDMATVVKNLSFGEFAGKLRPFSDMRFAEDLLSRYLEGNIEELPLPFACWATDANTNGGVLLDRGNLVKALCASSAVPPFFRAVEWQGRRLADGAYTNSIPADVCRNLGADFVISIDLSAYLKPDEEKSKISRLLGVAFQALTPLKYASDSRERGYSSSDVVLRPNLSQFRAYDVDKKSMARLYELGYEEATARMAEMLSLIQKKAKEEKLRV